MFKEVEKNLLYASNLWYFGEGLLGPLFVVYSQEVGGNIFDLTWAWASYLVVSGLATMFVGKMATSVHRQQRLALVGYTLNSLLTFGYIFVHSPLDLLLVQAGLGLACALSTPTWLALYAQCETDQSAGNSWGKVYGHSNIFTGIAFVAGGLIASYFSFTALFSLMGTIHLLATTYVWRVIKIYRDSPIMEVST